MPDKNLPVARLQRLNLTILLGFVFVALGLVFWSVVRAPTILAREDNPRLVEAELRVQRGRILDRNDNILAESVGPPDRLIRRYPAPEAEPAVGYYSLRHGTAGVEAGYDAVLRGDDLDFWAEAWQEALHQPPAGRDVRLTLDADWQATAVQLMGDRQGAALLMTLPDGGIRVMVSRPGYDPNVLDENFDALAADADAPLLNRATQGQYQPGLTLQPLVLAAAVQEGMLALDDVAADAAGRVEIGEAVLGCLDSPPDPATFAEALRAVCPASLVPLGRVFGSDGLAQIWNDFGLMADPELAVATETPDAPPVEDPALAALGQEGLTVSPLQVLLAWASLANNGRLPDPQLVAAVQDEAGNWQRPPEADSEGQLAVTPEAARAIFEALGRTETAVEHSALVLSGPEGSTNAWYLALAPAASPRYALIVVVEEAASVEAAQEVGRALLAAVTAE